MNGFEDVDTDVLVFVRGNLLNGLERIGERVSAGMFEAVEKDGAAPPSQTGWLTTILLLRVEDELECRIRGYIRVLDPNLFTMTLCPNVQEAVCKTAHAGSIPAGVSYPHQRKH